MASLQNLLSEEGFTDTKLVKNHKKVGYRGKTASDEAIALPIYICHDLKSIDFSKSKNDKAISRKGSSIFSSKRGESESSKSLARSVGDGVRRKTDEPALDEVATRAVISILSGYVGQYLKDEEFRTTLRQRCYSCFVRKNKDSDSGKMFTNIQLGIESIERLVERSGTKKEWRTKLLRNSISLLTVVASKSSRNGSTSATPNSHLSACAQLYLSVVYKLEKNDRIAARHLLQVFCDSPFLARDHLLPELWEHFFLPHLLHLKVWYGEEFDLVSDSDYRDKEKKIKILSKLYNDQMDMGTIQFAVYYKDWLKTGAQAPSIPSVPLPSFGRSRRTSSDSLTSHSSINKSLYRAVFGSTLEHKSTLTDETKGALMSTWDLDERNKVSFDDEHNNLCFYDDNKSVARHSLPSRSCRIPEDQELWQPEAQKVDYLRFLICGVESTEYSGHSNTGSSKRIVNARINPSSDLSKAINTISSSDNLSDCEMAIHVMTTAWLHSHGDVAVETALSKPPVIEGMIEVLFGSNNDEILELTISMLAEFVTRKEANGQIILKADPELDIFTKLLKSSSLFLKAATLLYLVKPKARHMTSTEWVPLVLRVLEFGDQVQTLFNVRCSPQEAAYYLLDQLLLTGFDQDKNWDNGRQVVTLGGLSLLARRMEIGDASEKSKAGALICCCIRADGSCRHYLADNLNKEAVLSLVVEKKIDYNNHAFSLLTELLCLQRTKVTKFLKGLMNGWSSLNTMQILLIYLQKAQPEQCPMIATIILQLDLLGDPLKCSIYREEASEAITAALESHTNEKVQEQLARSLLILGGRFSHSGGSTTENWLLKEAGFVESLRGSFSGRDNVGDEVIELDDEEESATELWQRKTAVALLTKKFVAALSESTTRSIPCLAGASLVTIAWMSSFVHSVVDHNLQSAFCSILVPELIKWLHYDNALKQRVLASYSLFNLSKCSGMKISLLDKELRTSLGDLAPLTWTASELFMISTTSSSQRYPVHNRTALQSGRQGILD